MSPTRRRTLAVTLAALLAPAAAAEQGWDPAAPVAAPAVGARWRLRLTERREVVEARRRPGDAAPTVTHRDVRLEAEVVVTVAQVESGVVAAWSFAVERWARRAGDGEPDRSLTGAAGTIDGRTGAVREDPAPAAPRAGPAQAFLKRLGLDLSLRAPLRRAVRAPGPVAAGAEWDAPEAGALVEGGGLDDVDAARSRSRGRLAACGPDGLEVRLEARWWPRTLPGTALRVAERGEYRQEVVAGWAPGDDPALGRWTLKAEFDGLARDQLPDGTPVEVDLRARLERAQAVDRP